MADIIERVERPAPAESFGQFLMEALRDKDIPADKLEIMLRMRREVLADQAREAYQAAYAAFQGELPVVEKDGWVDLGHGRGRYPFTTYEAMYKILRPLLAKHGFSIQFHSTDDKDMVRVTGTLAGHGWERSSSYAMPPDTGPGRNALQARGSARSYCKRYITDDLCNIVRKGQDDDGKGAIENLIDATQVKELADLIRSTNTNVGNFLKTMVSGAETVGDIGVRDFPRLVLALKEKQAKQKAAKK